jgi:hypothetical protein
VEPLPDIQAQVTEHAQRAFMLAQMEQRPPGYEVVDWALVLMDNTYSKLKARFDLRVQQVIPPQVLPAVPANPPAVVAAKARAIYLAWFTELARQECMNAIQPHVRRGRDESALRAAQQEVQAVLENLRLHDPEVRFTGRVSMTKEGSFQVDLRHRSRTHRVGGS